jgi:outer membrane protein assembly factor BamB
VAPTLGARLYKLDASDGAVQCSAPLTTDLAETVDSSPTIATPPGGQSTVYLGLNDAGPDNGPVVGVNEANCAVDFSTSPEPVAGTGGTWDPIGYAVDASGEGLVLFGTADPDSAVYAVDAVTGALVWRYAVYNPSPGTFDVGAGVTTTAPGVNGFADGMAYVESKYGTMYALDLTTGSLVWQYNYPQSHGISIPDALTTAALSGTDLVYGDSGGMLDVNAITGALVWRSNTAGGFASSPIITGPLGSQVAVAGDLNGGLDVLSLATGATLFRYQTGNFITASPAETDGNLLVGSGDGFLYDLALGGGTGAAPTTVVSAPANGSTLSSPDGPLTVSGTASASNPIGSVAVDIQLDGSDGPWWDGASSSWVAAP